MKAPAEKPEALEILRDGVFVAEDVRKNRGEIAEGVDPEIAEVLIKAGLARVVL